ncbi:flavodoxin family protein [Saccharothrix sp. ST-888]|uniref:flavodoxin family protein n=1 Tax=Saccharothrix sp. ST-888 TaxID=1427391 RepID=UPI0005ED05FA|nr:NAD(P)H-dependent oxidoreductase [Saccharothrix sp. ST-888]
MSDHSVPDRAPAGTTEPTTRSFLFALGSARPDGNAELLARLAAEQLPAEVRQRWIRLDELDLPAFEDLRHNGGDGFTRPTGVLGDLLDATLDATDLVIVSPLYWYSVSASTKLYLDHWSGWLAVPELDFKRRMAGLTLWGVSSYAAVRSGADPLVGTLERCAGYFGMGWGGVLLGRANRPGDIVSDEEAVLAAKTFFTR